MREPRQFATVSVSEAMRFARESHGDQTRKYSGEPYWKHLAEVAGIVATVTDDRAMIAAAWLHDTVEDTPVKLDEIRERFGADVAVLVEGLTDVSRPRDGNRTERKRIDRAHTAAACARAQTIKCADLISNTGSVAVHDPGFARIYLKEKRALLDNLGDADKVLYAEAERTYAWALETLEEHASSESPVAAKPA